ncbi:MAG: 2-oxoglutarate dehydrogenase E1 component [Rickettsia sp.]|nr:2-oxoglutarate dehydrogenase E1 component [Rickettsia sp.]
MERNLDELFFISNSVFLEELLDQYLEDKNSVDASWQKFFQQFLDKEDSVKTTSRIILKNYVKENSLSVAFQKNSIESKSILDYKKDILGYFRNFSKEFSNINPLEEKKVNPSNLEILKLLNINPNMLEIRTDFLQQSVSFKDFIFKLKKIYFSEIVVEFSYISDIDQQKWLYENFENAVLNFSKTNLEKKEYLKKCLEVKNFEQYIHKKFPAAKRFSIEGGETAILAIDQIIKNLANKGSESFLIAMAHRGRLSTLAHILEKRKRDIFSEFVKGAEIIQDIDICGDVKYHIGFSNQKEINGKKIDLYLASNPSHLEAINPVVCGQIRALQDKLPIDEKYKISGILIHGDASFAGQGVIYEMIMSSKLKQYDVGGVIHIIINNQIGYTTTPNEILSGKYCSNVAKSNDIPVLHVNGESVESVVLAVEFACSYKSKFQSDIIIDIICYRTYGHNEGDDPSYTQYLMYQKIQNKLDVSLIYNQQLIKENVLNENYYGEASSEINKNLDIEFDNINHKQKLSEIFGKKISQDIANFDNYNRELNIISTGISFKQIKSLSEKISYIPADFNLHPKLKTLFAKKHELLGKNIFDWAIAEYFSLGSLLLEDSNIRMVGQDTERGTFAHRHAALSDCVTEKKFITLQNLDSKQGNFSIYNSNLSEYAALGFEFGYSLFNHQNLTIWEAQFGDFFNGAQIIFDQFISSSEQKWLNISGLVIYLPHGFEGQGPEHSSARIERFLTLAAQNNIQIIYPTITANFFHILRLQVKRVNKKPLILITPKSLLRNKVSFSSIDEISGNSKFLTIIEKRFAKNQSDINSLVFCSGKIYYDILKKIGKNSQNFAIIRIEQIYPLDEVAISKILISYSSNINLIWVQEEPKNMGCWTFIQTRFAFLLDKLKFKNRIKYIGRKESASPASGYFNIHNIEQEEILDQLFTNL